MHSRGLIFGLTAALFAATIVIGCSGTSAGAPPGNDEFPIAAPTSGPISGGTTDGKQNDQSAVVTDSAYIVREGTLGIEVKDLPGTLQQAQTLVSNLGGYIAGSKESNDPDSAYAAVTYRFPVERWYDALAGFRAMGTRVVSESTNASDVTAQVVDMDARLANLRAAETQYQGIMSRAQTIDDVLKVQAQLTDTRGQIEQLQAQRDNLANRAALATLEVDWRVPVNAVASAGQGWDAGQEVDRAFAALVIFGQWLATLGIWLVVALLPIVLPVAIVAFIVYRLFRRRPNRVTMEQPPAIGA